MLRRFPIAYRIVFVVLVLGLTVFGACLGFYMVTLNVESFSERTVHEKMLVGDKESIRVGTHSLALVLGEAIKNVDTAAKVEVLRRLTADIRFEDDNSGYFFVYEGTTAISVPAKRSNEGKDLSDTKDVNGVYFVRELARQAGQGGGFVEYVFAKPDKGDQPKLAYAEMIPDTNYWIGTGVYIDNIEEERARISAAMMDVVQSRATIVGLLVVVILLLVVGVSIAIVRSIVVPIHAATDAARAIADGNLAVRLDVRGADEAAQLQGALQQMAGKLQCNVAEIEAHAQAAEDKALAAQAATEEARLATLRAERATSEGMFQAATRLERIVAQLVIASEDLARKSQVIRTGSETQKERIESTATAMEEMNATVLEVARNASFAAQASQAASQKAKDGEQVVRMSIDAMSKTQIQAEALRTNMGALGAQTQSIGRIMSVISDIADQTNLLALNAAIEAARAGDAGRGFAVVADEVRKLAEKTMGATKEVTDAILGIQRVAADNIGSVESAVTELETAAKHSSQSGVVLRDIVAGAETTADQIRSIATAAEEQSASSEEINAAVESISTIAVETAREIELSTQALQELARQTQELRALIEELKSA